MGVYLEIVIIAVYLKHVGTVACLRERLKMEVRMSASWSAHALRT